MSLRRSLSPFGDKHTFIWGKKAVFPTIPVRVKIEFLLVKAGGNLQGNYVCTILFLFQL